MKAAVYSISGTKVSDVELPIQFEEQVRPDLIKRAVLSLQSHKYQPKGRDPLAGKRQGKATPKRRHKYGGTYGYGISRVRRKVMWFRGSRFAWQAAGTGHSVKGFKSFGPLAEKDIRESINKKERRMAIRSAIAATTSKDLALTRNHKLGKIDSLPMIIEGKMDLLGKAKDVKEMFTKLGLGDEMERASKKKVRAGRGKVRGRKYRTKKGPLLVVGQECKLLMSARNIPGVDVVNVHKINTELLAPGTYPGRLTLWSKSAIDTLAKENLFK